MKRFGKRFGGKLRSSLESDERGRAKLVLKNQKAGASTQLSVGQIKLIELWQLRWGKRPRGRFMRARR